MSDKRNLRTLLAKLQNHLSDSDRRRLHSSFNEIKSERCFDNLSIDRILDFLESLFDQRKISDSDFNDFIEVFREMGSDDAVRRLSGRCRRINSPRNRIVCIAYQQNKLHTTQSTVLSNDLIINNGDNGQSMSTSASVKHHEPIDSLSISESHRPFLLFDSTNMIDKLHNNSRQSILKNCSRRRWLFLIFKIMGVLAVILSFVLLFIKKFPQQGNQNNMSNILFITGRLTKLNE